MRHQTFILKGKDILTPVSQFVRHYYQEAFLSEYLGGFLMVYEDYSFLNSNQLMVCLRLDSSEHEQGILKIEVISGGGSGSMVFGELFGSEKRRIIDFGEMLEAFCKEQGIEVEG